MPATSSSSLLLFHVYNVPPWEQYIRELPPAVADCLLSCVRTLAKVDGAVITHLRMAF